MPHKYKLTRNALAGIESSTKFSPWLACGAISPRQIHAALRQFHHANGESESSRWIIFELLWRDYFRFLRLRYPTELDRPSGLSSRQRALKHDPARFQAWCAGATGQDLVDSGMRELRDTGYLSNRMRQIVASYLVNELECDWRAGAAWFETQLIDFDPYSNSGNWAYIAGCGVDPRGGRHFNVEKQAMLFDETRAYRDGWLSTPDES